MKKIKLFLFATLLSFALLSCSDNDATREDETEFEKYEAIAANFDELTSDDLRTIDFENSTWSGIHYEEYAGDKDYYITNGLYQSEDLETTNEEITSDTFNYSDLKNYVKYTDSDDMQNFHSVYSTNIKGNADRTKLFFYQMVTVSEIGTGAHKMTRTEFHFFTKD